MTRPSPIRTHRRPQRGIEGGLAGDEHRLDVTEVNAVGRCGRCPTDGAWLCTKRRTFGGRRAHHRRSAKRAGKSGRFHRLQLRLRVRLSTLTRGHEYEGLTPSQLSKASTVLVRSVPKRASSTANSPAQPENSRLTSIAPHSTTGMRRDGIRHPNRPRPGSGPCPCCLCLAGRGSLQKNPSFFGE